MEAVRRDRLTARMRSVLTSLDAEGVLDLGGHASPHTQPGEAEQHGQRPVVPVLLLCGGEEDADGGPVRATSGGGVLQMIVSAGIGRRCDCGVTVGQGRPCICWTMGVGSLPKSHGRSPRSSPRWCPSAPIGSRET